MIWRAAGVYLRRGRRARLASRLLNDWCDYRAAHKGVLLVAVVDGRRVGQACFRHCGVLFADAAAQGTPVMTMARGGRR